jgi:hypothetical protein
VGLDCVETGNLDHGEIANPTTANLTTDLLSTTTPAI